MKNKYLIEGFKWFDKVNGNSYHTIKITDINENKIIFKSENLVYGYGDQYQQTAYKVLISLGLVRAKDQHNHKLNNERFIFRKTEDCLKRDILNL